MSKNAEAGEPFFKIYNETSTVQRGDFDGVQSVGELNHGREHRLTRGRSDWFGGKGSKILIFLLDPEGVNAEFRPASVLTAELERMNSVDV